MAYEMSTFHEEKQQERKKGQGTVTYPETIK